MSVADPAFGTFGRRASGALRVVDHAGASSSPPGPMRADAWSVDDDGVVLAAGIGAAWIEATAARLTVHRMATALASRPDRPETWVPVVRRINEAMRETVRDVGIPHAGVALAAVQCGRPDGTATVVHVGEIGVHRLDPDVGRSLTDRSPGPSFTHLGVRDDVLTVGVRRVPIRPGDRLVLSTAAVGRCVDLGGAARTLRELRAADAARALVDVTVRAPDRPAHPVAALVVDLDAVLAG